MDRIDSFSVHLYVGEVQLYYIKKKGRGEKGERAINLRCRIETVDPLNIYNIYVSNFIVFWDQVNVYKYCKYYWKN